MGRKGKANPFAAKKRQRRENVSFKLLEIIVKGDTTHHHKLEFRFVYMCFFFTLQQQGKPERQAEPYPEIIRDNPAFLKYYNMQNICADEAEWEQFLTSIRDNLPATFRVTGFKVGHCEKLGS